MPSELPGREPLRAVTTALPGDPPRPRRQRRGIHQATEVAHGDRGGEWNAVSPGIIFLDFVSGGITLYLSPLRTAVLFWGQTTWHLNGFPRNGAAVLKGSFATSSKRVSAVTAALLLELARTGAAEQVSGLLHTYPL